MKLSNRTVLITGGTSGIGLGLADAFLRLENNVIVCGRDTEQLSAAKEKLSGITVLSCDLSQELQRKKLAMEVSTRFPDLDILVNNAGIQRYIDLKKGYEELKTGEDEIKINLVAPIELTGLFIGHLLIRPAAAIINVSSGLGFMPMTATPIYSATKAAMHIYTLVLRQQLKKTSVKVIEIVPPMVDTNLNKEGRINIKYRGISVSEYIPTVIKGLQNDSDMIFYSGDNKIMSESRKSSETRLLN